MIIQFNSFGSGGGSGSGSTVAWRQDVTAGTQIAQITINGTSQSVYTPDIYTEKSHTEESEEVISRALNELSASIGDVETLLSQI